MTERREVWCEERLLLGEDARERMIFLFDQINYGKADGGSCLPPCKTTWLVLFIITYLIEVTFEDKNNSY